MATNTNAPTGFRPVKHMDGSPWNGKVNKYWMAAADGTATFIGDLVKLSGTADTDGYASIAQAAATDTPVGVVVSFEPNPANLMSNYRLASENIAYQNAGRWAYVADSPDLIMEAQEDGVGGALAVTNIGNNVSPVVGAGSTTTGISAMQVDSSTANTTSTLTLRLFGFVPRVDNVIGSANAKMLVAFNVHQYGSVGTTGV